MAYRTLEDRRSAEWRYKQSPEGRESMRRASRKYHAANRDKLAAQAALGYAVRTGRLLKGSCSVCGVPETQGHHADYSKPLEVKWLCARHHNDIHDHSTKLMAKCGLPTLEADELTLRLRREGKTFVEIARVLNVVKSTARTRYFDALRRLAA